MVNNFKVSSILDDWGLGRDSMPEVQNFIVGFMNYFNC